MMTIAAVLLLLVITLSSFGGESTTEIIGHRGASSDAPENTLAAINRAWEQNADGSECDVYLSKDGKIVVNHDADTKRTAGVSMQMASSRLVELRQLDVGK